MLRAAALLLAALAGLSGPACASPSPVAEFTAVKGEVRVLRGPKKELIDGEEDVDLFEGDEIDTLQGAAATISFVDHHLLKLGERSSMIIRTVKADPVKSTFLGRVRLVTGRLFASFGKAAGGGQTGFAVETRSAVAAVKGTTFGVEEGDAGTAVSVAEGVVATAPVDEGGKEGAAVDVPEGQETSVDARTRKVGGLRGFLNDDRKRWMKDELTGLKGFAGQFREMKKSGELDQIRSLRALARGGNLMKAGPALQALLLRRPGLRQALLEHADRHRKNLMNRASRLKLHGDAPADPGNHEAKPDAPNGPKESNLDKGLGRLRNLRRKK